MNSTRPYKKKVQEYKINVKISERFGFILPNNLGRERWNVISMIFHAKFNENNIYFPQ